MATQYLPLSLQAAQPDVSDTFPEAVVAGTNVTHFGYGFDTASTESIVFQVPRMSTYAGSMVALIEYYTSVISGGVAFDVAFCAIAADDSESMLAKNYDTVNGGSDSAVPGTANYPGQVSVTCSNVDSLATGDHLFVKLTRDYADANDTAAADVIVTGVVLQYADA